LKIAIYEANFIFICGSLRFTRMALKGIDCVQRWGSGYGRFLRQRERKEHITITTVYHCKYKQNATPTRLLKGDRLLQVIY